jgi:hypothetical protein
MYPPVELLEVMDVLADALSDAVLDLFRNQPDVVLRAMASLTLTVEEREQREADKARDWRKSGRSAMRTGDEILRKCIPLLASDKPGEVIAAAQAICKVVQGAGISLNDFAAAVTRFLELDSDMIRIFAPLAFNPSTLCDESDPTGEFNLRHWTFRRTQALDFVERPEFFHIPAKLKAAVRSFLATKPHIVTEGENDTLRAQDFAVPEGRRCATYRTFDYRRGDRYRPLHRGAAGPAVLLPAGYLQVLWEARW